MNLVFHISSAYAEWLYLYSEEKFRELEELIDVQKKQ